MGMLKGALKASVAMKVLDMARREAAKPANQAKAKALFEKLVSKGGTTPRR